METTQESHRERMARALTYVRNHVVDYAREFGGEIIRETRGEVARWVVRFPTGIDAHNFELWIRDLAKGDREIRLTAEDGLTVSVMVNLFAVSARLGNAPQKVTPVRLDPVPCTLSQFRSLIAAYNPADYDHPNT